MCEIFWGQVISLLRYFQLDIGQLKERTPNGELQAR